jgi:CBS domain-containing protein
MELISNDFRMMLHQTPISQVIKRFDRVVAATSSDTIAVVFKKINENRLYALPLWDESVNKYVAFIDLFDILAYLVEVLDLPLAQSEDWLTNTAFVSTSCLVLVNRSPRMGEWDLIPSEAPLQTAVNLFARGIHRLAVIDAEGHLHSILSQYRVVRWLSDHSAQMGPIVGAKIENFQLGYKSQLVSVVENEPAIKAFISMYRNNVSGVAVLDEQGHTIGNISVSDLKHIGWNANRFRTLFQSAKAFMEQRHTQLGTAPLISVKHNDSIRDLMKLYHLHYVHRVYVVSPRVHNPIGVITLTDLTGLFATTIPA